MEAYQHTIARPVSFAGVGLHSGATVEVHVHPAGPDTGIRFLRRDRATIIPAHHRYVGDTRLATTLVKDGAEVATVEHFLAACAGLGLDNLLVAVTGPEMPIMDGSALPLVELLVRRAGRRRQTAPRRYLKVTRPLVWRDGDSEVRVEPYDGFRLSCEIDFPHELIRRQRISLEVTRDSFVSHLAAARTFGFLEDIEQLRANGLARGGSLENAVVLGRFGVLNQEGLRFADEFVRHKMLDLLGDLALLGRPILGHVVAVKAGHRQHAGFVGRLAEARDHWQPARLVSPRGRESARPLPVLAVS